MPSTSPASSAEHIPPPLSYPGAGDREGHRLGAGGVTAIVALVAVVAAAVTAGVVLARKASSPGLPPPDPSVVVVGPAVGGRPAAALSLSTPAGPAAGQPAVAAASTPARPAATPMSTSASTNAKINLGPGITLTPASGWDIKRPGDNEALLVDDNADATLDVIVGSGQSNDSAAELVNDIQQVVPLNSNVTNINKAKCQSGNLDSRQFQQLTKCGFSADVTTAQATVKIRGVFVELMNPTSGMAAFAMFSAANPTAFDAATNDVSAMLQSML